MVLSRLFGGSTDLVLDVIEVDRCILRRLKAFLVAFVA